MIPQPGQRVKCFMRTSVIVEGIVEYWSDSQVVLKTIAGQNKMIICQPTADIYMVEIILEQSPSVILENIPKPPEEIKTEIQETLHKVIDSTDSDDQKLNIAQLRKLVQQQDRDIIINKRKEHFGSVGNSKQAVAYTNPIDILKGK